MSSLNDHKLYRSFVKLVLMKKLLFSIPAILLFNISFAQVHFGFKGGLNLANVKNEGHDNNKARPGFHAGGLLQFDLQNKFFLRSELLYSVKGYRAPSTQFSGEATVSLNYVNVVVLAGYQPADKLSVFIGPEFGFLTAAKSKIDGRKFDISHSYRDFDIGIDLGAAYQLNKYFGIDLRYNYGFKDLMNVIFTDQFGNVTGEGKAGANRVLQLGLLVLIK